MNIIGERLADLRKEKGLSQKEVAKMLGIDRSNYSKYELGKLEINIDMLRKSSQFYQISTDYILGLED